MDPDPGGSKTTGSGSPTLLGAVSQFRQNNPLMCREILSMLKPGESVAKALRRLGGGTKVKNF